MQNIHPRSVRRVISDDIELTKAECTEAHFILDTKMLFLKVKYYDAQDKLRHTEIWRLRGPVLQQVNDRAVETGNFGGDLVATCQHVVSTLEANDNVKATLLDNGQLKIFNSLNFTVS